jgi:hypothetical protein
LTFREEEVAMDVAMINEEQGQAEDIFDLDLDMKELGDNLPSSVAAGCNTQVTCTLSVLCCCCSS